MGYFTLFIVFILANLLLLRSAYALPERRAPNRPALAGRQVEPSEEPRPTPPPISTSDSAPSPPSSEFTTHQEAAITTTPYLTSAAEYSPPTPMYSPPTLPPPPPPPLDPMRPSAPFSPNPKPKSSPALARPSASATRQPRSTQWLSVAAFSFVLITGIGLVFLIFIVGTTVIGMGRYMFGYNVPGGWGKEAETYQPLDD
ncbi:uncharacterized protein VTP21DRAFT_11259 [Calcarisporiella thermophila]|uniref:uncharacterized protein n=1 Tax=Calcarisporiella thermophila TaxID=911321 RepID=UPI003742BC81